MLDIKTTGNLMCCVAIALGTVASAAQQAIAPPSRKPGDLDEIRTVSALVGTDIINHTNTKIAILRDLALSREGAVLYAILGYGGVAGVGETYTALPFDLLGVRHDDGKWAVNLDMTAADLKKAPMIKTENYRELLDPQWIARVDSFVRARGESTNHPTRTAEAAQREHRVVARMLLATRIRGAILKNAQSQDLGKVEDLLLDRMDHVAFVIVGRGGVLGIGENHIPIPWSKLGIGENRENAAVTATIDASKLQLEKAPLVKGGNYATMLAPGFAEHVRQYFGASQNESENSTEKKPH